MFTGLIEQVGQVTKVSASPAGVELRIESSFGVLAPGESIAVNGACLTVLESTEAWFTVAAMTMTIRRTSIGEWTADRRVNLERAARIDSRLGGHIVQGHVDGVGTVAGVNRERDAVLVDVSLPAGLSQTLVLHGSVALDGASLTVNRLEGDMLQVALIDYTLRHTALSGLGEGDKVHVETDVIGKHVQRLLAPYLNK